MMPPSPSLSPKGERGLKERMRSRSSPLEGERLGEGANYAERLSVLKAPSARSRAAAWSTRRAG